MKKVLFIHRSVGKNLINDGGLYALAHDVFDLSDYDHNTKTLTRADGQSQRLGIEFYGGDTRPEDYAQLFSVSGQQEQIAAHEMISEFDIIVLKSCYPNSAIDSEDILMHIKEHYTNIFKYFLKHHDKQLIVMTSPPLRPARTNKDNSTRARALNNWLTGIEFGSNISVFDFFGLLADDKKHMLKRPYRKLIPFDSHPNTRASADICPLLIEHIRSSI